MRSVSTSDVLILHLEDNDDREFLEENRELRNELQSLDDLCDGHTGWLGNQGPQPWSLDYEPALALHVDYDEDGRPRSRFVYSFRDFNRKDWRDVLLDNGTVEFKRVRGV